MPTYSVQIYVNVPGVGATTQTQVGIVAADIPSAIAAAKANIIVEPVAAQKTGA